jgi:AcrR family transcriptional regulator
MVSSERKIREFERREQEILSAALKLFSGERWESVTVTQIAIEADIGKGTVYKHFASKDEIYARLALDFFNGLLQRCRQIPTGDNPVVNLRDAFRDALHYHLEHQQYSNVRQYVFRAGFWERLSKSYVTAFEKLDAEFGAWANEIIERGMKAGEFRMQPLQNVRMGLDALFNGAVNQLWGNRCWMKVDSQEYIEQIVDFAINSLQAEQVNYK